ncbi:MAG: hypothetical protein WCH99_14980 [Verrucomicrobiota bacterium]
MLTHSTFLDVLVALCLFGGLVAALEVCFHLGKQSRRRGADQPEQLSTIQGAMLGMLALLLGFSFAIAAGRFNDRAQLIVTEANAISTAWMRCDLLPEGARAELHRVLADYIDRQIRFYDADDAASQQAAAKSAEALQVRMWAIVAGEAKASPALANVLLPPFNELMDLQSARVAASVRHMPGMLLLLLLSCSLLAVASVGYGCGLVGRRNLLLTTSLAFIVSGALWATIDMDHPRKGLIRVGQQPMLDLQKSRQSELSARPASPAQ